MRIFILILLVGYVLSFSGCSDTGNEDSIERQVNFDNDWLFMRDNKLGAHQPGYDDADWVSLDLPHDWSMMDLAGPDSEDQRGPFTKQSVGTTSTGYVVGGTGWYRKHFTSPQDIKEKNLYIIFDGVYMASTLWINGQKVGFKAHGYSPFYYDITPFLNNPGENNVISLKVENTGENSRWYSGSGIYRHVWLSKVNPVHSAVWGTYITADKVSHASAQVTVDVDIQNNLGKATERTVSIKILNPDKKEIAVSEENEILFHEGKNNRKIPIELTQPALWSPDSPVQYTAVVEIFDKGVLTDRVETPFGIRTISISAEEGFKLNGETILLKGGCMHHDNGLLGAAAFDKAESRRVRLMKENGFNAIRTAHNPPSKAFLDACDSIGLLVIDEAFDRWEKPKRPDDYHKYFKDHWKTDLTSFIKRDRNHPSVIMWSIGNEIPERADTSGLRIAQQLITAVYELDSTRPITNALCSFWDNPGWEWDQSAPAFALLDVGGYNYQWQRYESDHEKHPNRIMMGTESVPKEAYQNWKMVEENPYVIGDFVWTSMDYLGETGIGHTRYVDEGTEDIFAMPWPWYNAWCGDIDIIGNKKPQSYFRDVVWGESNLEMMVHAPIPEGKIEQVSFWGWPDEYKSWNWRDHEGDSLIVKVYSKYPEVKLTINGEEKGHKSINDTAKLTTSFLVAYQPGTIEVAGMKNGEVIETQSLETTGDPHSIILEPESDAVKADRRDILYVNVKVVDDQGRVVPVASNRIQLSVSGEAELLAAGNAKPDAMESFKDEEFSVFQGKGLVILRSSGRKGQINLMAKSEGLQPQEIQFDAE